MDIGPQQIELDYAYETKNDHLKIIKTFSFDYTTQGSNQAPQLAKEWAYNFNRIKSKSDLIDKFPKSDLDLTALIYVKSHTKNIKIALEILKEETNTIEVNNKVQITKFADEMVGEIKSI